jgi:hypothetical protein
MHRTGVLKAANVAVTQALCYARKHICLRSGSGSDFRGQGEHQLARELRGQGIDQVAVRLWGGPDWQAP